MNNDQKKYYVMPMFPYPSGDAMHVGHASNYIINDFVARFKKMQGYDVIHPMGFDSFGLPTENYAIKTGKSAAQATQENIVNFKNQIKAINLEFDPEREFATSDPEYYKWTQWIFKKLFENGLAYQKDGLVNRCNGCQTVLANDQVVDGKCERCETVIVQKKHRQRYFKTTEYADQLIDDLDTIDRPEETKTIQRNWIGRSFGAEIDFMVEENSEKSGKIEENNLTITTFTTRPDTLFGVTAVMLAPENQIIDTILDNQKKAELEEFRVTVSKLTSIDRQSTEREKNGMFSGIYVKHPLTGESVPVRYADYVLLDYATGSVMFVPAHDERDWEFAKKYGIDCKFILTPQPPSPSEKGDGVAHKKDHIYDGQDKGLVEFAKGLRSEGTKTEKIVWELLRDKKYKSYKFRRQHPIAGYIADFYCNELKLVVEIDGSIHDTTNQKTHDRFRDEHLQEEGLFIIRITNNEVLENPDIIYQKLDLHCSSPSLEERGPGNNGNLPLSEGEGVGGGGLYSGPGTLINSAQFDGLDNTEAKTKISEYLESIGKGRKKKTFRLRDWSVSRQRYRGSPIPVYYTFEDNQKVPFWEAAKGFEVKQGKPIITRNVVKVAIKHRSENKYLLIKNDKLGQHLVAGGVELGETREEAAIREAKEETIYTNFQIIKHIPSQVQSCFYNPNKEENRYLVEEMVVLQLINDEESPSELAGYEFMWIDEKELGEKLPYTNEQYNWYEYFDPSKKPTPPTFVDRYNAYHPHPDKSKWVPHLIPDEELPVILPLDLPNYKPAGKSPLEDHPTFKYYQKKEKLLLIHGRGNEMGDGSCLDFIYKEYVSKGYDVIYPKLNYANDYDFNKTLNELLEYDADVVIGHSAGGFLALHYANKKKPKQIILISPTHQTYVKIGKEVNGKYIETGEKELLYDEEFMVKLKERLGDKGAEQYLKFHDNDLNFSWIKDKIIPIIYGKEDNLMKSSTARYGENNPDIIELNHGHMGSSEITKEYSDLLGVAHKKIQLDQVYLRECDTLDTFMCSSFYFLRYLDPKNTEQFISDEAAQNMPVDLYIGGKEHAVGHLIYSRFIYKFLRDKGYVKNQSPEPFVKLVHQGMVHASDGRKFSKRRGNGINPVDIVNEFNTDTLRVYLAFMGPVELPKNWNPEGVAGVFRFLKRFEKLLDYVKEQNDTEGNLNAIIHQTIKGVSEDLENLKFNTAVSKLMIATNAVYDAGSISKDNLKILILLATPLAPETAQNMRSSLGLEGDARKQSWPTYDSDYLQFQTIELPVQINGKTKWTYTVDKDITQEEMIKLVQEDEKMSKYVVGGIKKVIRVPGRICNLIV